MAVKYVPAPDVQRLVERIASVLGLRHVRGNVVCLRAQGSRARWTIARVHGLSGVFQSIFTKGPRYVIEVIPAVFDSLSEAEKVKVLIHELLHVPKACGGGLRSHRFVSGARVRSAYRRYCAAVERRQRQAFHKG